MSKELIISATRHETRVAVIEEDQVVEIYHQRENEYSLAGSIHKGRVTRVLPGMQSAFVDIGLGRDAFLYVSDFFEDNDEYDKIVTSVEDKVLKLDRTPAAQTAAEEPAAEMPAASPVDSTVAMPVDAATCRWVRRQVPCRRLPEWNAAADAVEIGAATAVGIAAENVVAIVRVEIERVEIERVEIGGTGAADGVRVAAAAIAAEAGGALPDSKYYSPTPGRRSQRRIPPAVASSAGEDRRNRPSREWYSIWSRTISSCCPANLSRNTRRRTRRAKRRSNGGYER